MDKKEKSLTLADFIENNYKLISTLGVFIALTVYAKSLNSSFGEFLHGVFIIQAILIWYEIYMKIPVDTKALSTISFFQTGLVLPLSYFILEMFKKNTLVATISIVLIILIVVILIARTIYKHKLQKTG